MSGEGAIPFVGTGACPVREGNAVALLVDGLPAFERLCEAIEHDRHSVWATVGSANLHRYSLHGNGELNTAIAAPAFARAARLALFAEHLGIDTSGTDDVAALRAFGGVTSRNRERFEKGDAAWQGIAFRLDPSSYGDPLPFG